MLILRDGYVSVIRNAPSTTSAPPPAELAAKLLTNYLARRGGGSTITYIPNTGLSTFIVNSKESGDFLKALHRVLSTTPSLTTLGNKNISCFDIFHPAMLRLECDALPMQKVRGVGEETGKPLCMFDMEQGGAPGAALP